MPEPTKQMVQLIYSKIDFVNHGDDGIAEGLAEVFEMLEQTHKISEYCGDKLMAGVTCRYTVDEKHLKHRASMDGTKVEWV